MGLLFAINVTISDAHFQDWIQISAVCAVSQDTLVSVILLKSVPHSRPATRIGPCYGLHEVVFQFQVATVVANTLIKCACI